MRPVRCGFFALAAFFLMSLACVSAKTFTYPSLNCSCTVPDDWVFREPRTDLINAVDQGRDRMFRIHAIPQNPNITLNDPTFIAGFERPFIAEGYNIINRETSSLAGTSAYKIKMTRDYGNRQYTYSGYVILANGFSYFVECCKKNDDPDADSQLNAILASFTFTSPPEIPKGDSGDLAARNLGFAIGILLVLFLLVAFFAVAAGVAFYFYRQRGQKSAPKFPPPPPPSFPPPPAS
jgi:hypothetical protein